MWFLGLLIAGLVFFPAGINAGTVTFDDKVGVSFSFRELKEEGDNVPPSRIEEPSLYSNPRDAIEFRPSAFVAVESQLGSLETASLSSTLSFLIQATGSPIGSLFIDLTGTYAEHPLNVPGAGTPVLSTSLSLDPIHFTISGVTKTWSPAMNISRNMADQTWRGQLEVTQADLRDLFASPTMEVTELRVSAVATVSASAQWGSASSYLTTLNFGVAPIPEPNVGSLLLLAGCIALNRRKKR